jgi:hypothetical protein
MRDSSSPTSAGTAGSARVVGRTQLTCFTGTKVQILTQTASTAGTAGTSQTLNNIKIGGLFAGEGADKNFASDLEIAATTRLELSGAAAEERCPRGATDAAAAADATGATAEALSY